MDRLFGRPFAARTRTVLLLVVLLTAILALQPASADDSVIVTVSPDQPGYQIPADFLGLSYQSTDLAQDYFDINNTTYVQLLTTLGQGTLRYGGSAVAADGTWTPTTPETIPTLPANGSFSVPLPAGSAVLLTLSSST